MSTINIPLLVNDKYQIIKKLDKNTGFIVTKSGNGNIVNYSFIDDDTLIKPYWLMYEKIEKDKIPREDLTFLEKNLAYGIKVKPLKDSFYQLTIVGYPSISILLDKTNKAAMVKRDNIYYHLLGLYIHENPNNFIKKVDGVTVVIKDKLKKLRDFYISA